MTTVSYAKMLNFIEEHGVLEPEIDHSVEGCVSEDYWDKERRSVVAYTRYFDDGQVLHYIDEELTSSGDAGTFYGCGSNSCHIERPSGQGTNSQCTCFEGLSIKKKINLQRYIASLKECKPCDKLEVVMDFHGIEKIEDICPECEGRGKRTYGSTTTWRGGIGGQQMTTDVCDVCWGSGDIKHKGANLRLLCER